MHTFTDPAILFFVFGLIAGCVRSNLEIPASIARFLSLYLLMALGLKGGFALAASGLNAEVATSLGCAVLLAIIVPLIGYTLLKRFLGGFDAAALAATYGSVSAVTFITAIQHLETQGLAYGGHMAAAMALMESPAIIIAVFFANALRQQPSTASLRVAGDGTAALSTPPVTPLPLGKVLHESFTDGAQLLLLGAMLIGLITGEAGKAVMAPFSVDLFRACWPSSCSTWGCSRHATCAACASNRRPWSLTPYWHLWHMPRWPSDWPPWSASTPATPPCSWCLPVAPPTSPYRPFYATPSPKHSRRCTSACRSA